MLEATDTARFNAVVRAPRTLFCHESPAPARSFYKHGITDESVFCTVNAPSDFVTTLPKTRIWFRVPRGVEIVPDMRYGSSEDPEGAVAELLREHPQVNGADVCVLHEVPISWIHKIETVDARGAVVVWMDEERESFRCCFAKKLTEVKKPKGGPFGVRLGGVRDEDSSFGFEYRLNAQKVEAELKDAGVAYRRTSAGGIFYFHFDSAADLKRAVKLAKRVIDYDEESEW